MKPFKELINLSVLYLGKLGGILLTIIFIPIYRKNLDPSQFGLVSILISLQMIVYVLDFGFSMHLSRLASKALIHPFKLSFLNLQYKSALLFLRMAYFVIMLILAALFIFAVTETLFPALCALIILSLTLFNLKTALLLASQKYQESSFYQLVSSLARGGVSALALIVWHHNLIAFAGSQIVIMFLANFWIDRSIVKLFNTKLNAKARTKPKLNRLIKSAKILLKRCLPLLITAGVGALCTQADRFVIFSFISSADVGNYFLAATFALTPIVLAAQPIFQYFYPKIIESYAGKIGLFRNQLFSAALGSAIVLSSFILYLFSKMIIRLWLGPDVYKTIWPYASILLISSILAALSFGPYSLMLSEGRYQDLKKVTVITVLSYGIALSVAAYNKNLVLVCIAFLIYNLATVVSQTYFCLTYEKAKPLIRLYLTHWSFILPYFLVLSLMTAFNVLISPYQIYADIALFGTVIYVISRMGYSIKGSLSGKIENSIHRSPNT